MWNMTTSNAPNVIMTVAVTIHGQTAYVQAIRKMVIV